MKKIYFSRLLFFRQKAAIAAIMASLLCAGNSAYAAEPASPGKGTAAKQKTGDYPQIVLYSTSWCPHCKQAKEYFEAKKISFTLRDVELDPQAEKLLTGTYKSQGVPLVVIGTGANEVVLRGFSPQRFEEALKKALAKK